MESSTEGGDLRRRRRCRRRPLAFVDCPSLSLPLSQLTFPPYSLLNLHHQLAGISRDSLHKRRAKGAGPKKFRKKRK